MQSAANFHSGNIV